MRLSRTFALCAVYGLSLVFVLVAKADTPPPPQTWASGGEMSVIVINKTIDGVETSRTTRTVPIAQGATMSVDASVSPTGCRGVIYRMTAKTLLGLVAWRYNLRHDWCWGKLDAFGVLRPTIYNLTAMTWFSDIDPLENVIRTILSAGGHWYNWCWNGNCSVHGGHWNFRQGQIQNCLPYGVSCFQTKYPWLKVWVNGNGANIGTGGGV